MNILLSNLKKLRIAEGENPKGFIYDSLAGFWKHQISDLPYVKHQDFQAPGTHKKFDVETGEDYKGK